VVIRLRVLLDRGECRHCCEPIVLLSEPYAHGERFTFWAHEPKEDGPQLIHCWSPYGIVPAPWAAPLPRWRARLRTLLRSIRGR
jgi:hypothetical protein